MSFPFIGFFHPALCGSNGRTSTPYRTPALISNYGHRTGALIGKICFEDHGGHLGGDKGLIDGLYERMVDWPVEDVQRELHQVVHGHRMAFTAEHARSTGASVRLS